MFQPIKLGLSEYLSHYYNGLSATTKPLHEYTQRGLSKSIVWTPGRMIDSAEEMLAAWQRNDSDDAPSHPQKLPIILVAMAKDYVPSGRDYTRQVAERQMIIIPEDPKERLFGLRTIAADIRVQLAIFAADEPTARSLAAQFCLYIDVLPNRTFWASHRFAGLDLEWPIQLESSDAPAMVIPNEAKNLTILALDITLRSSLPLFDNPKDDDPNDGKGTTGDPEDPHGYPTVQVVDLIDLSQENAEHHSIIEAVL
ncbi:MAG: hypothetical protein ACOYM1_11585 [Methylovulum sp.]